MFLFAKRPDGHVQEGDRGGRRRVRHPLHFGTALRRRETAPPAGDRRVAGWRAGGQLGRKKEE
jgi:hypothetical protein